MSAPATEAPRAERLARWERRANPFIVVVAAVVPIVIAFTRDPSEGVTPFARNVTSSPQPENQEAGCPRSRT